MPGSFRLPTLPELTCVNVQQRVGRFPGDKKRGSQVPRHKASGSTWLSVCPCLLPTWTSMPTPLTQDTQFVSETNRGLHQTQLILLVGRKRTDKKDNTAVTVNEASPFPGPPTVAHLPRKKHRARGGAATPVPPAGRPLPLESPASLFTVPPVRAG